MSLHKTKADNFILISSGNFTNSEIRYLAADRPSGNFSVFQERMDSVLYEVDADAQQFYIVNNNKALNFKVSTAPFNATGVAHWKDYIPHRSDVLVEEITLTKDFVIVKSKKNGLDQFQLLSKDGKENKLVPFEDAVYTASFSSNADYNATQLRYSYSSPVTPNSVYDYNLATGQKTLLKQQEIPSGYNKDEYTTERVYVTAEDGSKVPLSIAYKKGFKKMVRSPFC
nr:hypothetical protein [Niabella hibiscisoli]